MRVFTFARRFISHQAIAEVPWQKFIAYRRKNLVLPVSPSIAKNCISKAKIFANWFSDRAFFKKLPLLDKAKAKNGLPRLYNTYSSNLELALPKRKKWLNRVEHMFGSFWGVKTDRTLVRLLARKGDCEGFNNLRQSNYASSLYTNLSIQ